jgi:hypothetical protein
VAGSHDESEWAASGAAAGARIRLDRPACGPPPGQRRPWQWLTDAEDVQAGRVEQARQPTEAELLARILGG